MAEAGHRAELSALQFAPTAAAASSCSSTVRAGSSS